MARYVKQWLGIAAVALSVAACAASDVPLAKSTTGRNPTVAEVPTPDETVRGDSDPAVVTLDLKSSLRSRRLISAEELPGNIIIPTTNLKAVPVTAALQAILSGTDVSLSWNTGALGSRLVTVMNLSGPLPKVVEKVCAAAKVFCDYRHGSLELSEKETFVVALPPMIRSVTASSMSSSSTTTTPAASSSSTTNSMVDAINVLLATGDKAQVDEQGGNIVYTAAVDAQDRVSQYLTELRTGRPLIVLQMYIWEVTLSRENAQGINWTSLSIPSIKMTGTNALSTATATAGSVSLGAVTSGAISASAVATFLASKGRVQTISNPQVTFVSGSTAQLKVGGTQRYISQVGTLTSSNVSGTTNSSTGSTSTNTVSTDSIDTGLSIAVSGNFENGVVFANLDMSLRNLISLNPTSSGGGTIDLPQTTDEKINTALRVRPGDSLLLAGLVASSDTGTNQGFPTGSDSALPLYGDDQRSNRELVIVVKPSVVLFSDKVETSEPAKKKEVSVKPLPDAVMIDKDGPHAFALPQQTVAPVAPVRAAAARPAPEPIQPELYASTAQDVFYSPSADEAPVDKNLMQRGFSRAYDQLLRPSGSALADGGGS